MARTWNDLLHGPPPRRNRRADATLNETPPPEAEAGKKSVSEPECDSDVDSEYERELREQEIRAKHRCFNKHCRCFEKDKENLYTSAELPMNATPTMKKNARPTCGAVAQQKPRNK